MARPQPKPTVITAAASRVLNPGDPSARTKAPDAQTLFALYDQLGPVRAAMQTKFYAASKITYYPARRMENDQDPEVVDDGPAVEAFERLKGPSGEFADFVAEMSLQWEIPGEGYLVGQLLDTENEYWDVWSPVEYEIARRGDQGQPASDAARLESTDEFIMRSWRPHPMKRELPDSPLRAVRVECEQFILFRDVISALARSRLIAPLLIAPNNVSLPDETVTFGDVLVEQMIEGVSDSSSVARLAPLVAEVDAAYADAFKTINLTQDLPEWVPEMLESTVRGIATGLDLPSEIMTGLADLNHWSAWLADDSLRLNYVDPLILSVLDSFTRGYLHPYLQERGVAEWESYLFWRDYSDLTSRTVTAEDTFNALDRNLITPEAARRSVGFTEADAPEDDIPTPATPTDEAVEVFREPPALVAAAAPSLAQIDLRLFERLEETAQAALDRALERAGAKIRNQVVGDPRRPPKDPIIAHAIDGVDNILVGQVVGRSKVAQYQLSDEDLIPESSFARVTDRARKLLKQGLDDTHATVARITGAEPTRNPQLESSWVERALTALSAGLVALGLAKLFTPTLEPDPAETGEVGTSDVPAGLIYDTMTIAAGGEPGDLLRGLANGQVTVDWSASVGFTVREREWRVGFPTMPFEPHQSLSGTRFEAWTSPALRTPLSASWLGVDFMFPGDHRGCQCVAELVLAEVAAEQVA